MDLRLGITHSPRELTIELDEDVDRDELRNRIAAALAGTSDTLWVTDRRGREIGVSASKLAYAELGSAEGGKRIGFGS